MILSGGAGTVMAVFGKCIQSLYGNCGKPLIAHALERAALIADEVLIVTNQDIVS